VDPEKSRLLQATIVDAADATFSILMGEDAQIPGAFIEDNALKAHYLDI
jgi:DNA gyrase/topoisomerase IV subunit B